MFRPEISVQADYTAATVSELKACRSIKGTAARKRLKIMEELKFNEKIVYSKIKYMSCNMLQGTSPVALPTAGKPLSHP
jgi:hypothetical protein